MTAVKIDLRERRGNFVHDFVGTPPGVHCPRFPVIAWGHGCQFAERCSYCYLRGTFRMEPNPVVYTNTEKLLRDVERDWEKRKEPTLYNAGELADSFLDAVTTLALVRLFARQDRHKLLLLTKDPTATRILSKEGARQTIVSFSINADAVSAEFEQGAGERLFTTVQRAQELTAQGYTVRFRIDPMIPIQSWGRAYGQLAAGLAGLNDGVELVTLGSLRYHPTVEHHAEDKRVFEYATEWTEADRRWRVPLDQRVEMYRSMIGWLCKALPGVPVGLCKETAECFEAMGMSPVGQRCNCVL